MELEKIKELIADSVDFDVDTVTEETRFDSMGLDSLDMVELLMQIDDEFGTETEPNASLVTVGDLINHIRASK